MPVGLAVEDGRGRSNENATTRPHWEPGNVYVGHAILVLPELGRLVDLTIEQVHQPARPGQWALISDRRLNPHGVPGALTRRTRAFQTTRIPFSR